MKNSKLLLICIYTSLLTTSIWAQTNVVKFQGTTTKSVDSNKYLRFDLYACKGDSIIGFNEDGFCYYSYNKGIDWSYSNYRNQLVLDDGINWEILPKKLFFQNNDVIIFKFGKFFVSKNFGKTFSRISTNKSLNANDNEIGNKEISLFDGYIGAGYYFVQSHEGFYKSKDCNKWEKLKIPEGVQATELTSFKNELYIATLKNIYKSNDYGNNWEKLDFIVFKKPVEVMRSLGGVEEMIAFDNKLYLDQISTSNAFTYVYDILTETETQIENIRSVFLKEDTLFLLSKAKMEGNKIVGNGEIFYYENSLIKSNIDLSNLCSIDNDNKYLCGITHFKLTNKYIVLDGKASLSITKNPIKLMTGCISGDCDQGKGTYLFENGEKYDGNFKNRKYNGYGEINFANGQKYVGEWKNHMQNGRGTYTYPDGKTLTGNWENGNFISK